ncbi:sialate O-acetylesterase [Glutamicibacter sp. NPDC087831]|uniref:sialate O-acetylesterase n=1 Tax=Glutamicibacter sp. NPDC087831 TaxID=3363998 RepID=UPI0038196EFD
MKRTNTVADALNTGNAMVDPGDGLPPIPIPLDGQFPGRPGPAGPGVPEGGSTGQYIEKTSSGTTQWATPTKAKVGLPNVDNTSDLNKPISSAMQQALDAKPSQIEVEFAMASKADLVGGKVPASQIPSDALVTDSNVASKVNDPLTGAAIDARVSEQVTPVVQQITADYIASDTTIVDAAAAAVNANPTIATLLDKNVEQDDRIDAVAEFAPSAVPDDSDFAHVVLDEAGRLIEGEKWDGTKYVTHFEAGTVDTPGGSVRVDSFAGYAHVTTDAAGKLLIGEREDGTIHIPHLDVDSLNGGAARTGTAKILIVAGQSNAIWRFNTDGPELAEPDSRLKWWNRINGTVVDVSPNVTPSIASAFARKYLEDNPDAELLIVPVTVGSTGFSSSSINPPPEGYVYSSGGTWDRTLTADPNNLAQRLFDSLAGALAYTGNAEVLAMLWSQGENDRTRKTEATYAAAFDDLVAQIRNQTGQPDLPVILGSLTPEEIASPQQGGREGTDGIVRAHENTQSRLFNTAYVFGPANHLQYNEQIHFSPEGNRERGERMAIDGLRRARLNLANGLPYSPRNPQAHRAGDQVTITWDYPLGRAVSFTLETSTDGITWASQTLAGPLATKHTITSSTPVRARINTTNESGTSYPTMEVSA